MAVEVEGFEMVQGPVETGAEGEKSISHEKENGKLEQDPGVAECINFGSHGDESAKAEGNGVSDSNVPKDAVEEWPAPKQIHSFYFARLRYYDDPSIQPKIDKLDKEINQENQVRFRIDSALKAKWVSEKYFRHGCLTKFVLFLSGVENGKTLKEGIMYSFGLLPHDFHLCLAMLGLTCIIP